MVLFGVRSPLVVEYQETCLRLDRKIEVCVSVNGAHRLLGDPNVVAFSEFRPELYPFPFVTCAFSSRRRRELTQAAVDCGLKPAEPLIDPTAVVARFVRIGAGSFINAGAIIGSVSKLGNGVLVNRAVSIGHHALVGDFVSIGPGATLASNIHVGDDTVIGAGAVVLPNIRIGNRAVIGAGSLIRRDVGEGVFVAGNPAIERPFDPVKSSLNTDGEE